MRERTQFDLNIVPASIESPFSVGEGTFRYRLTNSDAKNAYLELATGDRCIHFYDESCREELEEYLGDNEAPDIAIRAVQLPQYRQIIPTRESVKA